MEEIARVPTRHPPPDQRLAALPAQMTAQQALLSVRAETLASRPIVTCAPDDTVTQAARRMRDRLVSSLIVDSRPPGLVTATDLRDRVLAAGLHPDTPVRQVMTTPLQTIPADSTLGEVLLAMVDRGIHHLPLTRQGRLVGIVTEHYVLKADLVGFRGIHRTIAIRGDQTLVDVHYALQAAFDWDDDHLYSFWPDGEFYSRDGRE